jgi:hypothetical protein
MTMFLNMVSQTMPVTSDNPLLGNVVLAKQMLIPILQIILLARIDIKTCLVSKQCGQILCMFLYSLDSFKTAVSLLRDY